MGGVHWVLTSVYTAVSGAGVWEDSASAATNVRYIPGGYMQRQVNLFIWKPLPSWLGRQTLIIPQSVFKVCHKSKQNTDMSMPIYGAFYFESSQTSEIQRNGQWNKHHGNISGLPFLVSWDSYISLSSDPDYTCICNVTRLHCYKTSVSRCHNDYWPLNWKITFNHIWHMTFLNDFSCCDLNLSLTYMKMDCYIAFRPNTQICTLHWLP